MHRVEKTWHSNERPRIGHLLVEAGMIVFSILLALGIESWRERLAHKELAATALHNIREEIAHNRDEVRRVLPEHQALEQYLKGLADRSSRGEAVRPSTTYRPANLLTAAWDTSSATQAMTYVDFSKVQSIARLYSGHRWVQRLESDWLALTSNPSFQSPENMPRYVGLLHGTMRDLAGIEEEYANFCDQVLVKVDFGRE